MSYEMSQRITQQSVILECPFNIVIMNHPMVLILFEESRLWHTSHRTKAYKENAFALLFPCETLTAISRTRAPHLYDVCGQIHPHSVPTTARPSSHCASHLCAHPHIYLVFGNCGFKFFLIISRVT